jgi:hypothetical protein
LLLRQASSGNSTICSSSAASERKAPLRTVASMMARIKDGPGERDVLFETDIDSKPV